MATLEEIQKQLADLQATTSSALTTGAKRSLDYAASLEKQAAQTTDQRRRADLLQASLRLRQSAATASGVATAGTQAAQNATVIAVGQPMYDKDGNLVQMYSDGTTRVVTPANNTAATNAMQIIKNTLASYGLADLSDSLMSTLTDRKYRLPDGSLATDLVWEEVKKTPVYQRRFAPKLARDAFIASEVAAGRTPSLAPISEADQIQLEQSYKQKAASRGLPIGFYDNTDDFTNLIVNDISPDEFDQRITLAYEATNMAPPEVKAALKTRYGLQDSEIMSFYLDPEKAKKRTLGQMTRDINTAAVQATGLVTDATQADALAAEFAPGTQLLNTREFTEQAAALAPLSKGDITGVASTVTGEDVLRGVAGQTGAKGRLEKERQRRLAEYKAGGSLGTTSAGVIGLRSTADQM